MAQQPLPDFAQANYHFTRASNEFQQQVQRMTNVPAITLAQITNQLTQITNAITRLETKVTQLDTKVTQLDTKVTQLDTKVTQLDTKVTQLDTKLDTKLNTMWDFQ